MDKICLIFAITLLCSCSNSDERVSYYENGSIMSVEQINTQGQKEGIVKTYYESGELESEAEYKSDSLNGTKTVYYVGGSIKNISHWENGKQTGEGMSYYENGAIRHRGIYDHGKKVVIIDYREDGVKIAEQHFDDDTVIYLELSERSVEQGRNSISVKAVDGSRNASTRETFQSKFFIQDMNPPFDSVTVTWNLNGPDGAISRVERIEDDTAVFTFTPSMSGRYNLYCNVRQYTNTDKLIILRASDSLVVDVVAREP